MNHTNKRVHDMGQNRKKPSTGLPSASPPADLKSISLLYFNYLIRRVLLIKIESRLYIYLTIICLGSLLADIFTVPDSFFSNKRNFLNTYMVKIGWGWTLSILIPFIVATSSVYSLNKVSSISRHLMRLLFATMSWYAVTSAFNVIEQVTGVCQSQTSSRVTQPQSKGECITAGHRWLGVDVSGHVFMLLHSILTLLEEVRVIADWDKLKTSNHLYERDNDGKRDAITETNSKRVRQLYDDNTPYVRALSVCVVVLVFVWDLMLLSTVIYFHNMPQKVTAAILASLIWYVTYKRIYIRWPGLPGHDTVIYNKNL